MLTAVRRIFGRIMHSQTALRGQWDKGWKNNLLFASPSIRRPTLYLFLYISICFRTYSSFFSHKEFCSSCVSEIFGIFA